MKRQGISLFLFSLAVALLLCSLPAVSYSFPVPASGQQSFTYPAVETPQIGGTPAESTPLAVGPVASGGDTLSLRVMLDQFDGPVDIYIAVYIPSLSPDIWMIGPDQSLTPLSSGMPKWKEGVSGPIDESILGDIRVSSFPDGDYYFGVLVSPSGSLDNYYFWVTNFNLYKGSTNNNTQSGNSIVGTWIYDDGTNTSTRTYNSDGTFASSAVNDLGTDCSSSGTWSNSGSCTISVTATQEQGCIGVPLNTPETYNYSISSDKNTLALVSPVIDSGMTSGSTAAWVGVRQGQAIPSAPSAPTGITAISTAIGTVTVSWQTVAGANAYDVDCVPATGGPVSYVGVLSGTSVTITGLTSGINYYINVSSINAGGGTVGPPLGTAPPTVTPQ
jgi:Fibronectin type III domain